MTADISALTSVLGPPRRPGRSLLRAESRRFRKRRFIQLVLLAAIISYALTVAVAFTQYSKPSAADRVEALQSLNAHVAQQVAPYKDCIKSVTAIAQPESICGPAPTAADFGDVSNFLPHQAFNLKTDLPNFSLVFGMGFAALAFLIGATWIGAEWSSKNLVAWLTWEPRRLRVLAAKITVLVVPIAALAALLQLLWLGTALVLATTKGVTDVPADFWGELWAMQGRLIVFAVLAALVGFGLANLTRNMGAACGIIFLYFAGVETLFRELQSTWVRWLIIDNSLGFLQPQGFMVYVYDSESFRYAPNTIFISHWGGGLSIIAVVLSILIAGIVLFQRRDLT